MRQSTTSGARAGAPADNWKKFAMVAAGMAVTTAAAFGFGLLLGVRPLGELRPEWRAAGVGLLAVAPLAFFLEWFMRTQDVRLAEFRDAQIGFFAEIGFEFTPVRIAILSFGAGVSEELLFRGVFQARADAFLPAALAIILPNVLFGALHARTLLYAVIAGLVGIYLGALFWWTGNLLAPIVAHAAYDAYALIKTRIAIAERRPRV